MHVWSILRTRLNMSPALSRVKASFLLDIPFYLGFEDSTLSWFPSHATGCCFFDSSYWFLSSSSNSQCWRATRFSVLFFVFFSMHIPSFWILWFKYYVYAIDSQIYVFIPDLSPELWNCIPNCLLKTSIWRPMFR